MTERQEELDTEHNLEAASDSVAPRHIRWCTRCHNDWCPVGHSVCLDCEAQIDGTPEQTDPDEAHEAHKPMDQWDALGWAFKRLNL
jgi:hypothetical protein